MFFDLATAPFLSAAEMTAAAERRDNNPPATLLGLPVVHDSALPPGPSPGRGPRRRGDRKPKAAVLARRKRKRLRTLASDSRSRTRLVRLRRRVA